MAKQPKSLTEQLAEARAKVAELEKKLCSQMVGSFALVSETGRYDDIKVGTVVVITAVGEIDSLEDDEYPVKVVLLDDSDYDFFKVEDLELLTDEQARESLVAGIDRQLAEVRKRFTKGAFE